MNNLNRISIVVIGKNEGEKLRRCFQSIRQFIDDNHLLGTEIIYADSNSTDSSLSIAGEFDEVKILQLTGRCNAASARNVGAAYASNEYLVFVDGDMELIPGFYKLILDEQSMIKYDFVSGQVEDNYYDNNGKFLYAAEYYKIKSPWIYHHLTTGGLFLIKKQMWDDLKGMRTRFRNGQDLDLGLRMAQRGTKLIRLAPVMAKHHTVKYFDHKRMWRDMFRGLTLYSRGVLYRVHLLSGNKYIIPKVIECDPTVLAFVGIVILIPFLGWSIPLLAYLLILVVAVAQFTKPRGLLDFFNRLAYQVCRDILTIGSFFFFHPRDYASTHTEVRV